MLWLVVELCCRPLLRGVVASQFLGDSGWCCCFVVAFRGDAVVSLVTLAGCIGRLGDVFGSGERRGRCVWCVVAGAVEWAAAPLEVLLYHGPPL